MQYIEFVCTGNSTRSPLLEWIANKELKDRNIQNYQAISSGTLVEAIESQHVPQIEKVRFIERAIKAGFFNSNLKNVQHALLSNHTTQIDKFYLESLAEFLRRENAYRERIYKSLGAPLKPLPEQTKVRHDLAGIFPVTEANTNRVKAIYKGISNPPLISTYSTYALGTEDVSTHYPVWEGEEKYTHFMLCLIHQMPLLLERLLSEIEAFTSAHISLED